MNHNPDVLIIGAGPVGLLLGNLLGSKGVETVIVEKKERPDTHSRAIGITPPSLGILNTLELDAYFIREGVQVDTVEVHGKNGTLGRVAFSEIPSPYQFILAIPQQKTEQLLRENLDSFPNVEILMNHELEKIETGEEQVTAHVREGGSLGDAHSGPARSQSAPPEAGSPYNKKSTLAITARYLCGCDGFRSTVRALTQLPFEGKRYPDTFLMGDFFDRTGYGNEAHLFFTPIGSVESFPLPGNRRRWVIQTSRYEREPEQGFLESEVEKRAHHKLVASDKEWESPFHVHRYIMPSFYSGRILFLGDAAHTISPIGGQGMNTGFADAEFAASVLDVMLRTGYNRSLPQAYQSCRREAAETAARRAWLSMRVGTIRGLLLSGLRNIILRVILSSCIVNVLPRHYAMLTIPCRNLETVKNSGRLDHNGL